MTRNHFPRMWTRGPHGHTSAAYGYAIRGYQYIKSFENGLVNAVCHFDGKNVIDFKYGMQLLAHACGLWGFVLPPLHGHAMHACSNIVHEFRRYNTTRFQGIKHSYT